MRPSLHTDGGAHILRNKELYSLWYVYIVYECYCKVTYFYVCFAYHY